MILDNNVMEPKRKETKLKLKSPMSPQLTAPIIAMVSAVQSKYFILSLISFLAFMQLIKKFGYIFYTGIAYPNIAKLLYIFFEWALTKNGCNV